MAVVKVTELIGQLSNPKKAPRAILIHGADRSAVYELCQRVVKKIIDSGDETLNLSRLTEAQVTDSQGRLFEEFSSISMFGGNRVIWISAAGENLTKSVEPILGSDTAGNLILIDADALSKSSRLRKLFEAHPHAASVALYQESPHELRLRLERLIKSSGLEIDEEAMLRLLEFISFERAVAESETLKLITYCQGQATISVEDVQSICGDTSDASMDDLVDAVFEGKLSDVDRYAMSVGASASAGRGILSAVLQHIVKLQGMASQISQGSTIDSVVHAPRFGIFFKRRASISMQLRTWDIDSLLNAEEKICAAILQTRQHPDLDEALVSRALLALGRSARLRDARSN
jgi:DNA polymerase III subunit delta